VFVEILFPVLDLLRLVLRDAAANALFCKSSGAGSRLVGYACSIFNDRTSVACDKNSMLLARALCNAFHHSAGEQLMLDCGERLLATITMILNHTANSPMQVSFVCMCYIEYKLKVMSKSIFLFNNMSQNATKVSGNMLENHI